MFTVTAATRASKPKPTTTEEYYYDYSSYSHYYSYDHEKPKDRNDTRAAVIACIKLSAVGNCAKGPDGPIGSWNVSRVTNMEKMFNNARSFNGDISKWDVS